MFIMPAAAGPLKTICPDMELAALDDCCPLLLVEAELELEPEVEAEPEPEVPKKLGGVRPGLSRPGLMPRRGLKLE